MAEPRSHILAPVRRDPSLRLHMPEPEEDGQEGGEDPRRYRAVETSTKPARLILHPRTGPLRMPGYATLIDVIATPCGTGLTLIYSHMEIEVLGQNLVEVALAVGRHRAATLREYDPQKFDLPGEGEPVIEGVTVEVAAALA